MIQLVPQGWLGWKFDVLDNDRKIAEIKTSTLPESSTFSIDGTDFRAYREGMFSGDFFLESDGQTIASAQKPSAFLSSFSITHVDRSYTLKKQSFVSRAFILFEGDREAGFIRPEGFLTRKATVSLPEIMPRPVQLFVIWLAILLWKRESDSGAAVAASVAAST
ncbi:MAG: hypothetical protein JO300_11610 [Silvibacterium sp.]|nr:hypothetical protein [Silvibacterium sp.]MBV8437143.1 hypothetical protein [Silvibacterium sp.]